jgi:hypothetical protein
MGLSFILRTVSRRRNEKRSSNENFRGTTVKILVSITSGSNNTERNILRAFYDGIEKYYFSKFNVDSYKTLKKEHDIDLRLSYDPEIEKCDVAVQFGTVKERSNEHHVTKQSIRRNAKTVIYVETPILGRIVDKKNNYLFYRVGVGGFLNNDGLFYDENSVDPDRFNFLKTQLEIPEFPGWKNHKQGNILILLQLPGDASLRGQQLSEWFTDTVKKIRSNTDRNISVRFHPAMSEKGRADFFAEIYPLFFENYKNILWQDGISRSIKQDLIEAGVCVSYSSGSSIDAVLQGVPCITIDEGNLAYPISSHRLDEIENPKLASEDEINLWLNYLANSQWNEREMIEGKVWNHIVSLVEQSLNENSSDLS